MYSMQLDILIIFRLFLNPDYIDVQLIFRSWRWFMAIKKIRWRVFLTPDFDPVSKNSFELGITVIFSMIPFSNCIYFCIFSVVNGGF